MVSSDSAISKAKKREHGPFRSFLSNALGVNRFDDRLDTKPNITTAEVLNIFSHSLILLRQVRWLFSFKIVLQVGMLVPGLLVPWLAKIVIDNAVLQIPIG